MCTISNTTNQVAADITATMANNNVQFREHPPLATGNSLYFRFASVLSLSLPPLAFFSHSFSIETQTI